MKDVESRLMSHDPFSTEAGVHRRAARDRVLGSFDRKEASPDHVETTVIAVDWRTIMRHPAFKLSAASLVITAALAGLSLLAGSAPPAYAQLVQPLLEAKTGRFVMTKYLRGEEALREVGYFDGAKSRTARRPNTYQVMDGDQGLSLEVFLGEKRAVLNRLPDGGEEGAKMAKYGGGLIGFLRWQVDPANAASLEAEGAREKGLRREEVEETTPNGVRRGVRVTSPAMTTTGWADPETGQPTGAEIRFANHPPGTRTVLSDFELDVEVDPELFSLDPPVGYELVDRTGNQ